MDTATTLINEVAVVTAGTPRSILDSIDPEDYKQFLIEYRFGGVAVTDLSAEGVKTLALQFGISTGDVEIDFLDDMRTEALFTCTATNMQTGQTATVKILQEKREYGNRSNR